MENIEARVKKVIATVLNVDAAQLKPDTNFVFDLGADSQQSTQLVLALEEEFGVEFDMEKAVEVQSVSGAVDFVKELI